MNWIKTDDQLPNENQKVIYFFEYTGVSRGKFKGVYVHDLNTTLNCFYSKDGFLCDDVTHWMPDEGQNLNELNFPEDY